MTLTRLVAVQTGNGTIEGYLQKIALGYKTGTGSDCRKVVADAIRADPDFNRTIAILADSESRTPTHCVTLDSHGRIAADRYRGKLSSDGNYTFKTGNGFVEDLVIIYAIPTQTFLSLYCSD